MTDDIRMVPVHVTWNEVEAEVIAGKLRSNGIEAIVESASFRRFVAGSLAEIRLLVPEGDVERAQALIEESAELQLEEDA